MNFNKENYITFICFLLGYLTIWAGILLILMMMFSIEFNDPLLLGSVLVLATGMSIRDYRKYKRRRL